MTTDILNIANLHYSQLMFVLSAFLVGGLVKGMVGFGMPLTVITILATVLPAKFALGINVLPALVLNIRQTGGIKQSISTFRRVRAVLAGMVCGIIAGSFLQTFMNDRDLQIAVGVVTVVFCIIESSGISWRIPDSWAQQLGLIFGAFSGLLYALTTVAGPPLIIYLIARQMRPAEFRYSVGLLLLLSGILLTASMIRLGIINQHTTLVSAMALVPATIGMALGKRLSDSLNTRFIKKLTVVVLAVVGARLVYVAI